MQGSHAALCGIQISLNWTACAQERGRPNFPKMLCQDHSAKRFENSHSAIFTHFGINGRCTNRLEYYRRVAQAFTALTVANAYSKHSVAMNLLTPRDTHES